MNIEKFENIVKSSLKNRTNESKRVFHGRGNFYENFSFLTVDSINDILFAIFYEEDEKEQEVINTLLNIAKEFEYADFIVQKRYEKEDFTKSYLKALKDNYILYENSLAYSINFKNKNIGFFLDAKNAKEYLRTICKDKKVLNLFSYTCSFSVVAAFFGAKMVVNVDMAKNALNTGRQNHILNKIDTKNIKFLPYNILKSWSRIKKDSPYDIVIIDPPSFQKGSFDASRDYEKIVKRLEDLTQEKSIVIACLNDPFLDTQFLKSLFENHAKSFEFIRKIDNLDEFKTINEEKSLKILIFYRNQSIIA